MIQKLNDWSEIDWKNVNRNVKNLRARIYQARVDNDFRKVRNLQGLMLKSESNFQKIIQFSNSKVEIPKIGISKIGILKIAIPKGGIGLR